MAWAPQPPAPPHPLPAPRGEGAAQQKGEAAAAAATHLVITISMSIFSVGYSSQAARPRAQGDSRWQRGAPARGPCPASSPPSPSPALLRSSQPATPKAARGPRRPQGLTDVLRVEGSDHQQEGPGLPVESGDGQVRRLVPETRGVERSASAHKPTMGRVRARAATAQIRVWASVTPPLRPVPPGGHGDHHTHSAAGRPALRSGHVPPAEPVPAREPATGQGNTCSMGFVIVARKPNTTVPAARGCANAQKPHARQPWLPLEAVQRMREKGLRS